MCSSGDRAKELLRAASGHVEGFRVLHACHVAQATESRLSRIESLKMRVVTQLSSPSRGDMAQPCSRRGRLQRQKLTSVVDHGAERDSTDSPRNTMPQWDGRRCNAVQCTLQASGGGTGTGRSHAVTC